jgi:hypothetical protein
MTIATTKLYFSFNPIFIIIPLSGYLLTIRNNLATYSWLILYTYHRSLNNQSQSNIVGPMCLPWRTYYSPFRCFRLICWEFLFKIFLEEKRSLVHLCHYNFNLNISVRKISFSSALFWTGWIILQRREQTRHFANTAGKWCLNFSFTVVVLRQRFFALVKMGSFCWNMC